MRYDVIKHENIPIYSLVEPGFNNNNNDDDDNISCGIKSFTTFTVD